MPFLFFPPTAKPHAQNSGILKKEYIYSAFKSQPNESMLVDRMLTKNWIRKCMAGFLPLCRQHFSPCNLPQSCVYRSDGTVKISKLIE